MTAARRPPGAGRAPRAGARPGLGPGPGVRPAAAPTGRAAGAGSAAAAAVRVQRTRRTTRLAVLGLICLGLVVAIAPTLRVYLNQRDQIDALKAQQQVQLQQVAALQQQADRWNDPAYVAAQARERLHFVSPGQRSYVVLEPAAKPAPAPASGVVAGTTGAAGQSWFDGLWTSVRAAGASTQQSATSSK